MRFLLIIVLVVFYGNFVPAAANVEGTEDVKKTVSEEDIKKVKHIFRNFTKGIGKNPKDYVFEVHNNKEINAYATLGKKIVINSGLMNFLENESALAFVIAHELGHVERKHVIKGMARRGLSGLLRFFVFKENRLLNGIDYFHVLHYSRSKEREADLYAEELMAKFYCKDTGKLEFFEKMAQRRKQSKVNEYFTTHPLPASRFNYLKAEIEARGCVI